MYAKDGKTFFPVTENIHQLIHYSILHSKNIFPCLSCARHCVKPCRASEITKCTLISRRKQTVEMT